MMRGAVALLCIMTCAGNARAQYEEAVDAAPPEWRYLWGGAAFRTFDPLSSNAAPADIQIEYRQVMAALGLRQGPVDLSIGYGQFEQRGESHESIVVNLLYSFPFPLAGSRSTSFMLPILLGADYTKAGATGPERNTFNVASVGVGAGLELRHRTPGIEMSVRAGGLVHYSTEAYNVTGGFSAAAIGEAAVLLPRVGILDGLAFGYRIRYQSWSMSDEAFDYHTIAHGPFLGVML